MPRRAVALAGLWLGMFLIACGRSPLRARGIGRCARLRLQWLSATEPLSLSLPERRAGRLLAADRGWGFCRVPGGCRHPARQGSLHRDPLGHPAAFFLGRAGAGDCRSYRCRAYGFHRSGDSQAAIFRHQCRRQARHLAGCVRQGGRPDFCRSALRPSRKALDRAGRRQLGIQRKLQDGSTPKADPLSGQHQLRLCRQSRAGRRRAVGRRSGSL